MRTADNRYIKMVDEAVEKGLADRKKFNRILDREIEKVKKNVEGLRKLGKMACELKMLRDRLMLSMGRGSLSIFLNLGTSEDCIVKEFDEKFIALSESEIPFFIVRKSRLGDVSVKYDYNGIFVDLETGNVSVDEDDFSAGRAFGLNRIRGRLLDESKNLGVDLEYVLSDSCSEVESGRRKAVEAVCRLGREFDSAVRAGAVKMASAISWSRIDMDSMDNAVSHIENSIGKSALYACKVRNMYATGSQVGFFRAGESHVHSSKVGELYPFGFFYDHKQDRFCAHKWGTEDFVGCLTAEEAADACVEGCVGSDREDGIGIGLYASLVRLAGWKDSMESRFMEVVSMLGKNS